MYMNTNTDLESRKQSEKDHSKYVATKEVGKRVWKNSGFNGIRSHDLCETGTNGAILSYTAIVSGS